VPDVTGLTQEEAVTAVEAAGLVAQVIDVELADGGAIGSVQKQDPAAGTEVDKGSVVKLDVPTKEKLVAVPDVRGENQADATRQLEDAGFKAVATRKESSSVDTGLVIEQTPLGGQGAAPGSTVEIVISSGPAQQLVKVPDVEGLASTDAQTALTNLGLTVVIAENSSTQVAKDVVISQLPAAGDTVAPGTSVGIVVSTGPPATADEVVAPDVVGVTLAEAQQVMTDAGLEAIPVPSTGSGKPANEVVAQTPEAGAKVQKGSGVVLFYSSGQ
jgi:serine/threonine-protein kinase